MDLVLDGDDDLSFMLPGAPGADPKVAGVTTTLANQWFMNTGSKTKPNGDLDDDDIEIDLTEAQAVVVPLTVDFYGSKDQRTHVYETPDTYVGSAAPKERKMWTYDHATKKMVWGTIYWPPACERVFIEVISNASDHVGNSRMAGVDAENIIVTFDNHRVTVTNHGLPILVEMTKLHDGTPMYVPQMIFGNMLAGTSFRKGRTGGGRNGIGAKTTNIFSVEFSVIVRDNRNKKEYRQTWHNNMKEVDPPIITEWNGPTSSCTISYLLDFARFGIDPVTGYSDEAIRILMRHAIDACYNAATPMTVNGISFDFKGDAREHGRLYYGDLVDKALVWYQWGDNKSVKKRSDKAHNGEPPRVSMLVIETIDQDELRNVSFANCIPTHNGGTHLNAAIKALTDPIVNKINEDVINSLEGIKKPKKGQKFANGKAPKAAKPKGDPAKKLTAAEKKAYTITAADVTHHITIIVSVRVIDPIFDAQTKGSLEAPTVQICVDEDILKPISRWGLIARLRAELNAKHFTKLMQNSVVKGGETSISDKYTPANWAGGPRSLECILCVSEGDSGDNYAQAYATALQNRNAIGTLPVKGKVQNVLKLKLDVVEKIGKNLELMTIIKALGLVFGADYGIDENFRKLKYGHFMIMTDADEDGGHIRGLLINFFNTFFPSLLHRCYLSFWRTPIVGRWRGGDKSPRIYFYTAYEHEMWISQTPDHDKYEIKYYKGLGSTASWEIPAHIRIPKRVTYIYDPLCKESMQKAFDPKFAEARKTMIRNYFPQHYIHTDYQAITDFINQEWITYSVASTIRAIPALLDGCKEVQRKILHGAFLNWKIYGKKPTDQVVLPVFSNFAASKTKYHHGNDSMQKAIVNMSREFGGTTNNLNLFTGDGQFGNDMTGEASNTKYLFTKPCPYFKKIFHKTDLEILTYLIDENKPIEPRRFLPIIPMVLINGSLGVATGFSSFIPCYHPFDIINWLRQRLHGRDPTEIPMFYPWYRFCRAIIRIIDRKTKGRVKVTTIKNGKIHAEQIVLDLQDDKVDVVGTLKPHCDNLSFDLNQLPVADLIDEPDSKIDKFKPPAQSMATYGRYRVQMKDRKQVVIVEALPMGLYGNDYRKWLNTLINPKGTDLKLLDKYELQSKTDDYSHDINYFELYGYKGEISHEGLNLIRSYGLTNMVLLDEQNHPIKYSGPVEIIDTFYQYRLPYFQKRKDHILDKMENELQRLKDKMRFIMLVNEGKIKINKNTTEDNVRAQLIEHQLPTTLFDNAKLRALASNKIGALQTKIDKLAHETELFRAQSIQSIWLDELNSLERELKADPIVKQSYEDNLTEVEDQDDSLQVPFIGSLALPVGTFASKPVPSLTLQLDEESGPAIPPVSLILDLGEELELDLQ